MPILDEFNEVEDLGGSLRKLSTYSRSPGSRGPFRFIDGQWGALKDLFDVAFINGGVDILFYRSGNGVLIEPFVKVNGNDYFVHDVLDQFPGYADHVDYERHGFKYSAAFTDGQGRLEGLGFQFTVQGPNILMSAGTKQVFIDIDPQTGEIEFYDIPTAILSWNGNPVVEISSEPLFKREDLEWRPYRDQRKVRIDLTPTPGRLVEIDPVANFVTVDSTINGTIFYFAPSTALSASATGTTKNIGSSGGGTPVLSNMYDRFDLSSLPTGITVSSVVYTCRIDSLGGTGAPDDAIWTFYLGWNILSSPLVTGDLFSVRNQSGRYLSVQNTAALQSASSLTILTFLLPTGWIYDNGGSSGNEDDNHDVEVKDTSVYSGTNGRVWNVRRGGSVPPQIDVTYTIDPTVISMNEASSAVSAESETLVPGATTISVSEAISVLSSVLASVLPGGITKVFASTGMTLSPVSLSVVPGPVTVSVNEATLVLNVLQIILAPGGVTIALSEGTFSLSAESLTTSIGGITVALSEAVAALTTPIANVVPGARIVIVDEAGVQIAAETVTITADLVLLLKLCEVLGSLLRVRALTGSYEQVHSITGSSLKAPALTGDSGCECN